MSVYNTLKKVTCFNTSFSSDNSLVKNEHKICMNEQRLSKSLSFIFLLGDVTFDTFNQTLWTYKLDYNLGSQSEAFLEIIRHSLCFSHLVYRTVPEFVQNHERTHFIENIIPSLLAFAKITGFLEFKSCETPFVVSKCLNLKDYDYHHRFTLACKLIDAIGIMRTQNNLELIIVEASRKEASHYRNASLQTFKNLKVISFEVIKTQVTLCGMSLFDSNY
ncbi:hypothetical protein BDB01DRAFT_860522 [Pilobolus umbonatus]|nr:hypothetical protein BDB01DRAFT_860522 [Pilobolus umbonatus]